MKRRYLYIILAIVVVGTAGYYLLSGSSGKDVKYRTDKVTRGDVSVQVRATGTINPVQTVQVGSQVSGIISKIYVDYNTEVKKNQIIAVIDSTLLNASVKEARANLERNQAQVNDTRRTLDRTKMLFEKNLVAQADLDAATTAYESAVAQLKQTAAALDRTLVNLRYAVIRSPIDGVVISRDVDVGQTVAASLQTPNLFKIANDLKQMQVEASVDEADIGQISEGQGVTFSVDSYPDEQFHGSVTQVRLAPINVQNVVTYTVIIAVPNPDLKLRPGMTATVSIMIDRRSDVLRIPTLALRFQPPADAGEKAQPPGTQPAADTTKSNPGQRPGGGERRWRGNGDSGRAGAGGGMMAWKQKSKSGGRNQMARVWVLQNGKDLVPVSIRVGLNDNRYVELLGGELNEGDEIVIGSSAPDVATNGPQQSNPFQQRGPGGGGGGRRGF
jgi:HlyD family secretion protein